MPGTLYDSTNGLWFCGEMVESCVVRVRGDVGVVSTESLTRVVPGI